MKTKDTQLLEEAYNFINLRENIITNYLVNPLKRVVAKLIAAVIPMKHKVDAFETVIDAKVSDYKKYLRTKKYSPEDSEVVEWEKENKSAENFEKDLYDGFDLFINGLKESSKLSEQEKQQLVQKLEDLKGQTQSGLDLFKLVNVEDDREKFNAFADRVIKK